mmetsp:Transcript_12240/g.23709  ORF Transcript_12240/g.23709 Transcript_12240/m.23709 type:complete len:273 (-) Transcript_12240:638-1456(-)
MPLLVEPVLDLLLEGVVVLIDEGTELVRVFVESLGTVDGLDGACLSNELEVKVEGLVVVHSGNVEVNLSALVGHVLELLGLRGGLVSGAEVHIVGGVSGTEDTFLDALLEKAAALLSGVGGLALCLSEGGLELLEGTLGGGLLLGPVGEQTTARGFHDLTSLLGPEELGSCPLGTYLGVEAPGELSVEGVLEALEALDKALAGVVTVGVGSGSLDSVDDSHTLSLGLLGLHADGVLRVVHTTHETVLAGAVTEDGTRGPFDGRLQVRRSFTN